MPNEVLGSALPSLTRRYKRVLAGADALGAGGGLESFGPESSVGASIDLSTTAIGERVGITRAELHRIVKEFLEDKLELHEIADKIAVDGKSALKMVGDEDDARLASGDILTSLEAIVRTDGSRPSFMVRNGVPDRNTSPVGTWGPTLDDGLDKLRAAIDCIGRIDDPSGGQGFQGTGILIAENLVITNRHVLQAAASQTPNGDWALKPNISIDFGHEFRAQDSLQRRIIKGVVFAGSKPIDPFAINHSKLDVALLELAPANTAERPKGVLALDASPDWGQLETGVFVIGFPGNPGACVERPSLLELLFKSTYGCKRLAPGLVTTTSEAMAASPRAWTLGHDATTLAGNSGSAVLVIGRERLAAGLHYGGRRTDPRENWCHVLGRILDETDGRSGKTLREHLVEWGVRLDDRLGMAHT